MKKEFLSFLACLLLGVGYILSIMACSCLSTRTDKLFHTINVPLSSEDTLRVSSFIDTFDIVRLETNDSFLLSQVAKVKVVKDRIYVLDIVGNALYVFHLDGSFVGKVSQVGGGPGEYVQLMDFDVSDTSVYLLDFARQNILEFNKEFTYRRSIQYKHIASQFVATDSGFCLYNEPSGKEGEHLFTVMDKKGDVLSEMLPRKLAAPTYNYGGRSAFAKHGGVVYYSPIYGNSIYSDSTLVWQIQFGAKSLPEEEDIGNYDISASDFPYLLKNNFWVTTEYVIFEMPKNELCSGLPCPEKPYTVMPDTDSPYTEKPAEINKEIRNKELLNTERTKTEKDETIRHKYGMYKNVLLSDEELQKLISEFPADYESRIERLSEYMASSGKHYKSHLATIRSWARSDAKQKKVMAYSHENYQYEEGESL